MAEKIGMPAGRGAWAGMLLAAVVVGAGVAFFGHQHGAVPAASWKAPQLTGLEGKPEELRKRLTAALSQATASRGGVEGVAELGRLCHANSLFGAAEGCWRRLRIVQPGEAHWAYYLADLRRLAADDDGLRAGLEETIRLAPGYAPAWLELAELEFKTGRLESAERAYRQRLSLSSDDPYANLGLARLALQRGERSEGKRLIEEILRVAPEFPSSRNIYAEILAQEGDRQGAANQRWMGTMAGRFRAAPDPWKEELRPYCYDSDQLIVWGEIDLQTRRGDRGRACFERAVAMAPRNPRAYESLGVYHLDVGDAAKAREVLEAGSQLPDPSELLFVNLCDAYQALHQPEGALQAAQHGLARLPGSGKLHNARGRALEAAGRLQEAMDAYLMAIAAAPGSADPVANLGLCLMRQGRREEAQARMKQALELQPMFPKAITMLAYLELDAGNLPGAAAYIFPYFGQFPGLPEARVLMGRYYLTSALAEARRGDFAAVEKVCRAGLGIVPDSPELNGFLGINYLQQGRIGEALTALETAYRMQPEDPRIALSLAELYVRQGKGTEARQVLNAIADGARRRKDAALMGRATELLKKIP